MIQELDYKSSKIETFEHQFEQWRSSRVKKHELIPQHLWQAAAQQYETRPAVSRAQCKSYVGYKHIPGTRQRDFSEQCRKNIFFYISSSNWFSLASIILIYRLPFI